MKPPFIVFALALTLAACGTAPHRDDGREVTASELRFVEKGTVEFRTDADRRDVFDAARREMRDAGRVLNALPSSGRIEGVVDASRVVVSLLPVDAGTFRVVVEARPMAGDRDARDVAERIADGIADRIAR